MCKILRLDNSYEVLQVHNINPRFLIQLFGKTNILSSDNDKLHAEGFKGI